MSEFERGEFAAMRLGDTEAELTLVAGVVGGQPRAVAAFLSLAGETIWPAVVAVEGEGPAAEAAFLEIMAALRANAFARLRGFDGHGSLRTFLVLVARNLMAEQIAGAFSLAPDRAWRRFERLLGADIGRRLRRRFPRADESQRADLYQEVCLKLVEADYRRIRAYSGQGSFTGYVLTVVERLLLDLLRQEAPRRRLPAQVARAPLLNQLIFRAVVWAGVPADTARLSAALQGRRDPDPSPTEIEAALRELAATIEEARAAQARPEELSVDDPSLGAGLLVLADEAPSAEARMLADEDEAARAALVAAVKQAADALPAPDRLYLQIIFQQSEPTPPRQIARLMGLPVEEVYQLRQRTQRWLGDAAANLRKKSRASV